MPNNPRSKLRQCPARHGRNLHGLCKADMDLKAFPFIATTLPMGVRAHSANLAVSCCLSVNKYFSGLTSATNYDDFYRRLQNLRVALNSSTSQIIIAGGTTQISMSPLVRIQGD